jgi:Curli production assembly/transport component CsgG.
MTARKILLFILCSSLLMTNIYAQGELGNINQERQFKVAVFDPVGKVEDAILQIVREEISSILVNHKDYTVLERQLIDKVLEENKFQGEGMVDDSQISEIGKILGADYVFVSTINPLNNNYYFSCKMIEVATARIEKQFTGTTKSGLNDIMQTTQFVIRHLLGDNDNQQTVKVTDGSNTTTVSSSKKTPPAKHPDTKTRQKQHFDIGYDFPIGGVAETGIFSINTSRGFQLSNYFFIGAGLGLNIFNARDIQLKTNMSSDDNYPQYIAKHETTIDDAVTYMRAVDSSFMTMPIFFEIRGCLPLQNGAITTFTSLRVGYAFNLSDGFGGMGLYFNPALGVKFKVSPKIGINFSFGYSYQSYGGLPKDGGYGYYYIKDATKTKYEAKGAGGLNIKLGVEF